MAPLYKLTDQAMRTHDDFKWEMGVEYQIPIKTRKATLCSSGVFHCYRDHNLALLMNPIHAQITNPRLFKASGWVVIDDGTKCGCYKLKLTSELPIPSWHHNVDLRKIVQIRFAILCAESVTHYFEVVTEGDERPRPAIMAAKEYIKTRTSHAARAADAARAAHAAADAADAAAATTKPDFCKLANMAADLSVELDD